MITWILIGVFLGLLVLILIFSATSYTRMVKTYKKYDKEFIYCNLTGLEFTEWAIDALELETKIYLLDKELDECYLPKKDIVCISNHTAETSSVSSICVAAHELGHAVQNKKQTSLFVLQSCLTILAKICTILFPLLLLSGIVLIFFPAYQDIAGILLLSSVIAIFFNFLLKIFTIPMEMEASKIAFKFLKENNVLVGAELKHGKKVLNAAIGTYVASLFMGIIKFFRRLGRSFRR